MIVLLLIVLAVIIVMIWDHWKSLKKLENEFSEELKKNLLIRLVFGITLVGLSFLLNYLPGGFGKMFNLREQLIMAILISIALSLSSLVESYLKQEGWI